MLAWFWLGAKTGALLLIKFQVYIYIKLLTSGAYMDRIMKLAEMQTRAPNREMDVVTSDTLKIRGTKKMQLVKNISSIESFRPILSMTKAAITSPRSSNIWNIK